MRGSDVVATGGEVAAGASEALRDGADRFRSVAQLNMLHSLAAKLNSLGDAAEIGAAITGELRTIIDYHSCRVYLLQPDGSTLLPVAFMGEIFSDYEKDTVETLTTKIGEGITGHVAESRESLLTPDAREIDFAVTIPGTDDILESMLAVPMEVGDTLIGVIVLSTLGYGKFDDEDQRLLEVLASHAAVAFENANLFQAEREAAETSASLLRLSQALTQQHSVETILQQALDTIPNLVACAVVASYLRDEDTGMFRLARWISLDEALARPPGDAEIPPEVASAFERSEAEPFALSEEIVATVPEALWLIQEPREVLVAPLRWEPERLGALVLVAPAQDASFSQDDLRLARQ